MHSMELGGGLVESLKEKSILITGSTGFLAKIFVEKVLRVQPNVKKLFLLVRASDSKVAAQRLHSEVTGKELFRVLKEKHGKGFQPFISDKLSAVAGDIVREDLGIEDSSIKELMWREIDIVVNVAATTNFYERYDVALNINVLGAKNVLEFAKKCQKLEMLLHVSTAYVAGERGGIILETPFSMGETLAGNSILLDIDAEVKLVEERLKELQDQESTGDVHIKAAMKELGLTRAKSFGWPNTYVFSKAMGEMLLGQQRGNLPLVILRPTMITSIFKDPLPGWIEGTRTIDSIIAGYAKGKLTCFIGDPKSAMDVIPGDMVVNAMIVSMVAHSNQHSEFIYHVSSSVRNAAKFAVLQVSGFRYFAENPRVGKDGKPMKTREIPVFTTMDHFRGYMNLRYKLPLQGLRLVNAAFCRFFSKRYNELNRKYNFVMHLAGLYEPYAFFKGRFDDANLERLRVSMAEASVEEANLFGFDPRAIDWEEYFTKIHIPGVLQYALK